MDKDTNYGHYFTFPLKFLWFPQGENNLNIRNRLNEIICWSIIRFIQSGKCGSGTNEAKFKKAQKLLSFCGASYNRDFTAFSNLQPLVKDGDIYTSIKTSYLFEARDGKFPIPELLLLAAVKSVIGPKRNFTKTYRSVLTRRMFGDNIVFPRYRFDKIMNSATDRGLFKKIPAGKGFYVSVRYRTIMEFQEAISSRILNHTDKKAASAKAGHELIELKKKAQKRRNPNKTGQFSPIERKPFSASIYEITHHEMN
jgi:hypothetical protein